MKLLLDSPDAVLVEKWAWCLDGITVNPTTLSAITDDPQSIINKLIQLTHSKEFHLQVTATIPDHVYAQALAIHRLAPQMIVKIPCIPIYFSVIERLVREHVLVNVTLVFSLEQAYAMARFNVHTVSVFIHRAQVAHRNTRELLEQIAAVFYQRGYVTELLAASLHTQQDIMDALRFGADAATVSSALLENFACDQLSNDGFEKFQQDWSKKFPGRFFPEIQ